MSGTSFWTSLLGCAIACSLSWNCCASDTPWEVRRTSPPWAQIEPMRRLHIQYDPSKTAQENGALLALKMTKLQAGDQLIIGAGRYSVPHKFNLDLQGTAEDPIWIIGENPEELPIITRPDERQNVLNVGERSRTEYICLRHLEFTGGSTLIRIHDGHHLWIDRCHLHDAGAEGITANSNDTSYLYVTRNHFHDFTNPQATGEAMYLGGNHGKVVMAYSVIAENHVHHCGGKQGDGIEVKHGSHHNWIYKNHVHDTNYPCILVYGTEGNGLNVIEQNLCYRSNDSVLQVQGEAIVRNNVLIAPHGAGFSSTDHQGKTRNLHFAHNTIIAKQRGANLSSWDNRLNMLFANNAIYTDGGDAVRFPRGSAAVVMAGNVVVGRVSGTQQAFITGTDLQDFEDVSWDANRRNAAPSKGSLLIGKANPEFSVKLDFNGSPRRQDLSAGALGSH